MLIAEAASLRMIRSQHALILVLSLVSASQVLGKHRIGGMFRETKRAREGGGCTCSLVRKHKNTNLTYSFVKQK